ncbi:MAG: hypothetical protein ABIG85_05040 [Chloroflexota bacterium]
MTVRTSSPRGGLIIGLVLILLGGAALLVQVGGLSIGWPTWILVPGIGLVLGAVAVGGPGGSGMAAVGGIVTMVGVVLAVQDSFGLYQTWAYAWALVAPGGVGAGLTVYGILARRGEDLRGGLGVLAVGVVLFLVGFLFFEGLIGLSGRRFGNLAEVGVPLVLVGIGVIVLLGAFIPGPWRRPYVAIHHARGQAAGERGDGGTGWSAPAPDRLAIPLEGATDAEVMVTFGAGHLRIGPAAAGMLVDGTYAGGVKAERGGGPGRVRLSPPAPPSGWRWDRAPYTWTMGVSGEVPLRLRVEAGAADAELDLGALRLAELRLRTGASETRIGLPAAAGFTRVDAEGGAAAIRFRVPDGVAARIRTAIALGSSDIDAVRFPRNAEGSAWESADFASAANRVEIEVRGGIGSVSVR